MELTNNEIEIIKLLRDARPFERIEITKDQEGRVDWYIIHRSQKVIFSTKL